MNKGKTPTVKNRKKKRRNVLTLLKGSWSKGGLG